MKTYPNRRRRALALVALTVCALSIAPASLSAQAARQGPDQIEQREVNRQVVDEREVLDGPGNEPAPESRFFRLTPFLRGDTNTDGVVDISDPIDVLGFLFLGTGRVPSCMNAADTNADSEVDLSDAVYSLLFLFGGGPPPEDPGPSECGVDRRPNALTCDSYPPCPDDFPLISHVLKRITFGATEELYTQIQTRADLIRYMEAQLDPPANYEQEIHEPTLHARVRALDFGFKPNLASKRDSVQRLKAMTLMNAVESEWQLLHVLTLFWNNHFHTQVDTLPQNFFGRFGNGGGGARATEEIFEFADTDDSGELSEAEWDAFRAEHPSAIQWNDFRRANLDGSLSLQDFLDRQTVAYWKYGRGYEQAAIAAEMENREFEYFRRNAFGSFSDLLEGSAKSVAMLIYLNGFENNVAAPNENYSREFLELFSKGADHKYTQRDIEELARVFTGWTVAWVRKSFYEDDDILYMGVPESTRYPLNVREPAPNLPLPDTRYWSDDELTWGFVFGGRNSQGFALRDLGHDWNAKNLFMRQYGGVDSLGNPLASSEAIRILANVGNRTTAAALNEFDRVLDSVSSCRDTAKFLSTKLIQLFVTDDLNQLAKDEDMLPAARALFDAVDDDNDEHISLAEWETPVPLVLPNGRPLEVFETLDTDHDDQISLVEYQEPDLLIACIEAWSSSDGNIREVVRTILFSDEFLSLKFYRAKIKTPFEFVTSALRIVDSTYTLQQLLATAGDVTLAGMEQFNFSDPTGESELGIDWVHTVGLLERLKFVSRGADPVDINTRRFQWSPTAYQSAWRLTTAERSINFFAQLILNGDLLENHRELALEAYRTGGATISDRLRASTAFILSLPPFQKQ